MRPPNANKPWTARENELVRRAYPVCDAGRLSRVLGRSWIAIRAHACSMGVGRAVPTGTWTKDEEEILAGMVRYRIPPHRCAAKLGRTTGAVKAHIKVMRKRRLLK